MALTLVFLAGFHEDASDTSWTSGAFDSTGYEHIYVGFKFEGGGSTTVTVTDNKSSSFSNINQVNHSNGDLNAADAHAVIGAPGSGHTVTITLGAARAFKDAAVWGVHSTTATTIGLEASTAATGNTFTTPDAGSLVNTRTAVSFQFAGGYTVQTGTPGTGWTEDYDAQNNYGQSRGPDAAGTIDPSFTWTGADVWASVAASFSEQAGGGGGGSKKRPGIRVGGMMGQGTIL